MLPKENTEKTFGESWLLEFPFCFCLNWEFPCSLNWKNRQLLLVELLCSTLNSFSLLLNNSGVSCSWPCTLFQYWVPSFLRLRIPIKRFSLSRIHINNSFLQNSDTERTKATATSSTDEDPSSQSGKEAVDLGLAVEILINIVIAFPLVLGSIYPILSRFNWEWPFRFKI